MALISLGATAFALYRFRPTTTETRVRVLKKPRHTKVNSVDFSPDGKSIALAVEAFGSPGSGTSSFPAQAQIWNVDSATKLKALDCRNYPGGYIDNARFSRDGKWLTAGSEICNLRTKTRIVPIQDGDSNHTGLLFSPDNRTIAASSKNCLALWHLNQPRPYAILGDAVSLRDRTKRVPVVPFIEAAAFSPDGRFVVTGNTSGAVILWDVRRKK